MPRCPAQPGGRRIAKAPYGMSAVVRGQGRTTNGQEAATARDTALRGEQPRMAEYRVVARSVVRDRERGLPVMPGDQAAHGAAGAEEGWRARCRETRRGRRTRRQGNTRRRAAPHLCGIRKP